VNGIDVRLASVQSDAQEFASNPSLLQRLGYVKAAVAAAGPYSEDLIARELGRDFLAAITGILAGFAMALGVSVSCAVVGAIVAGGIGAILTEGAATLACARIGAEIGLLIAQPLLVWLGIACVYEYIKENWDELKDFRTGINRAWTSDGRLGEIDAAAREIATGVAVFFRLAVFGIVVYVLKSGRANKAGEALKNLRGSVLFRLCPKFETWLSDSFWQLKLKVEPNLKFTVMEEGPAINPQVSSIPEYMKIDVNGRVWELFRNKGALDSNEAPQGPVLKHLHEYVEGKSNKGMGTSPTSGTDFPYSALAGALSKLETVLILREPGQYRDIAIGDWEFSVDTTKSVWRIFHASYVPKGGGSR
jgi:hypothetical protein